ncbi:MAG: hypothetical protein PSV35_09375 [bacterium]|nr:hypothetical protein [bacterium]
MKPNFLPKYTHGDALLRNFLRLPDGRQKIIDVRGIFLPNNSPALIDISYELGGIIHGFLLEIIRANLFDLKIQRNREGLRCFFLQFQTNNTVVANFLEVRNQILNIFQNHVELQSILHGDPYWMTRAIFSEATHFLTDAINRLEQDSSGRHTVAYYLIGATLLSSYAKELFLVR